MPGRLFDLSSRTKLRLTGADRVRFINGQTTNDVRKASAEATQESCVLNAKGHLEAHLFLFATADAIWMDAPEELRESLPLRLERYVIADDVSIEDVTDQFALFHALGDLRTPPDAKFSLASNRLGAIGRDLWCEASEAPRLRDALAREGEFLDVAAIETLRVQHGIPRWGRELTPEIIPPEANLEARAIDYEKGCYIGQEVISRMKMSGQTRQRLCRLVGEQALTAGMELRKGDKAVGKITSAVFSPPLNANIALALVKRGFTETGTELVTGEGKVRARITPLPFVM